MKNSVDISIIIPNYNREAILHETLDSLLDQSNSNWEAIIVDDGSTDRSMEIAQKYQAKDSRFKVVERTSLPKGAGNCRNLGLSLSRGTSVIFLDSDDILAPHCLERRQQIREDHKSHDFLVFQIASFTAIDETPDYYWNINTDEPDVDRFMKLDAVWQTSSVLWQRDFLLRIGGFDPQLACWQDVDIHLRALLTKNIRYKKFFDETPDMYYRRHDMNTISQQNIRSREKLLSRKIIIQKLMKLLKDPEQDLSKLQFMVYNVILSASGSPYFNIAIRILWDAFLQKIISLKDSFNLFKIILFKKSKLYHFPGIKNKLFKMSEQYIADNQVCKVPIQQIN